MERKAGGEHGRMLSARIPPPPAIRPKDFGNLPETVFGNTAVMDAPPRRDAGTRPVLAGYRVGVVAHRGRQHQAEELMRLGAEPVLAPVVDGRRAMGAESLAAVTEEVIGDPPAVVVLTSATGVEAWLAAAEELAREQSLRRTFATSQVLARGAATAVAATALGVTVDGLVHGGTQDGQAPLPAWMDGLAGRRVALQFDAAGPGPPPSESLRRAGAVVVEVDVPVAGLPVDPEPALRLLEDLRRGRVDALTFTAPVEVRNLLALAERAGSLQEVTQALNDEVTVACISRACECVAVGLGLIDVVRPERARVGAMVDTLVGHLREAALRLELAGIEVSVQGTLAVVDGRDVWLTGRDRALLAVLARRPGTVVSKAELLRRVWRADGIEAVEGHAVEVAVGRLRRRLGPAGAALQTVPRRGYRLVGD